MDPSSIPVDAGSYPGAHEQPRQNPPGANVIRHAESGPVFGHTGICHQAGVEDIEHAMANERGGGQPEVTLKPCNGNYQERSHYAQFDQQSVRCSPHHCKQDVVVGNYDHHSWIESAIPIQSY
jgi:hypothetical protein